MRRLTPHPAASRPPSPAGGEGIGPAARRAGQPLATTGESATVPHKTETGVPHAQPSPLAGEGGARCAPGEGDRRPPKRRRVVSEPVAFARQLRRAPTDAEKILWQMLRVEPFRAAKFRRQVPIGPYVADFLSYSSRLVVEVDGPVHEAVRDARRDAWFDANGWRVLRFTNDDVVIRAGDVSAQIASAIEAFGQGPKR